MTTTDDTTTRSRRLHLGRHLRRSFVAYLALFIAVSMTPLPSWAAGMITSEQIKNNTIKSIDVRDNSLKGVDITDGSLRGADIANGSLSGADLAPGLLSSAVTSTLPSGKTVRGTIGGMENNLTADQEVGVTASLPVPAPVALDDDHVAVNGSDEPTGACPGTAANPTAAPGYVCIYPWFTSNATALTGYIWGAEAAANAKYGFQLGFYAVSAGPSEASVFANWAYTAP